MNSRGQAALGGLGVFGVTAWPPVLVWLAGSAGSLGDLRGSGVLLAGMAYSVVAGTAAGFLLHRVLARAGEVSPRLSEVWGAYVLAVGVYALVLSALPLAAHGLFLSEENESVADRLWAIGGLWVGWHVVAWALGALAGWLLLRPRLPSAPRRRA